MHSWMAMINDISFTSGCFDFSNFKGFQRHCIDLTAMSGVFLNFYILNAVWYKYHVNNGLIFFAKNTGVSFS